MFEFGFLSNDSNADKDSESESPNQSWLETKEILPKTDFLSQIMDAGCTSVLKCKNSIQIKYVAPNVAEVLSDNLKDFPIFKADKNHSDLVTGVYEGGLKIWECTYDLLNHITDEPINLKDKKILDLGCGAGIIGILALVNGSSQVYFQDYNEEIIEYITIPNTYLNSEDSKIPTKCKFYSGDWNSFLTFTESDFSSENNKFDYIFTSETIYNPLNYKKLHNIFKKTLNQNGIVYLAAKTHYFGVGGGIRQFEDFLKKENLFDFSVCWKCSEGLHREILQITFKKSNI